MRVLSLALLCFLWTTSNQLWSQPANGWPAKHDSRHLPNLIQLNERVFSGGLPADEAAFAALAALGVKTVISVDGARPDVATARRYDLRYVHLPHGYDGIPQQRVQELAKAVRDLPGPIYIHCHHGKHRSPAAASVACVAAGLLPASVSQDVLRLAGTNPGYLGLIDAARNASALDPAVLDGLVVEYREVVHVPPMAEAMVTLADAFETLEQFAAADWMPPESLPDRDAAHEALLLREQFTELLRTPEVTQQSEPFQQLLGESEASARQLETLLRQWTQQRREADLPSQVPVLMKKISADCRNCHVRFRDIPRDQKR